MRFGCCADLDKIEAVRNAGYDYIELAVANVKAESSHSEFEHVREIISDCGIVPEVWNRLLPDDMNVVGEEVDLYRIERYLRTAFERIEELRGEIVVFGSGTARSVPVGFSVDEADDQLVEFLTVAGQVAGAYGICVAVEPLDSSRTNNINTIAQAVELVTKVDHPFVKVLVDLGHMQACGEPLSAISAAAGEIVHAHVSDADRLCPGSGNYPIEEFIDALKAVGYDDRLSVECAWRDFDVECVNALELLRRLN